MTSRIYTLAEFYTEKPKGELLLRDDAGVVYKAFQCHGCQSCWEYDPDADTIEQVYPHFYQLDVDTDSTSK